VSQPIYVIKTSALCPIIDRLAARYTRSAEWGYNSADEVKTKLGKLEERTEGWVDCARVAHVVINLHTSKMIGGANRALTALVNEVNASRDIFNKT